MPTSAGREDVRRLQAEGALVVEALPRREYDWKHILGAISLPLEEMSEEAVARLDRGQPVVTYCHDFQ